MVVHQEYPPQMQIQWNVESDFMLNSFIAKLENEFLGLYMQSNINIGKEILLHPVTQKENKSRIQS